QARLRQIAWLFEGPTGTYDGPTEKAVRGFQGKRGLPRTGRTDTVTWQRLKGMGREAGRWERDQPGGQPADAPDPRCRTGRVLCISKESRTLRWMADGRTLQTLPVRFGSQYTPTREGVFSVYWKSRDHWSTLYDSPMPYAMFFSGGQAVHFSADFAARGYAGASHGCVNVRAEAAIAGPFAPVRNGDTVAIPRRGAAGGRRGRRRGAGGAGGTWPARAEVKGPGVRAHPRPRAAADDQSAHSSLRRGPRKRHTSARES